MVPHFTQSKKVGVANVCLPLDLSSSDGHAIVFSISQKPHNSFQSSEGKQCCKFGLLYSDGFMLLLQDKLQGGTESCIRTREKFLGFSLKEPAPHTRHSGMTTVLINACWKMEQRNGRVGSNDAQVLQIYYQLKYLPSAHLEIFLQNMKS